MDLITMRSELRRLSELVAGWDDSQDISPLERDLALEKLRRLYEALRFGTDIPAADDASPVSVPLSIELDDVLVSVSVSEEEAASETGAAPEREAAAVPEAAPENGSELRSPMPETESACEPVPDPVPEPEGADAAEVFEELTVRTMPAREEVPAPVSVPESEPEPAPVSEASSQTEPFRAEPQPVAEPESAPIPESLKPGSAPAKPEPAPQSVAPTLFELEAETVRHRRKQRVIMSLYDTEPAASAPTPKSIAVPLSVPTPEPISGPEPTPAEPKPRKIADAKEGETMFAAGEPVSAPLIRASAAAQADAAAPESGAEPRPASVEPAPAEPAAGTVLGEVINHDKKTLSDTIAPPRDVASELRRSESVADLRRAVGINDKFLLIRDLFGGDGAAYEITIRRLNEFDNFDDCMIYIAENFAWNPNSDGAKLLLDLLERKFS